MNLKVLEALNELNEAISNSDCYSKLLSCNKIVEENDNIMRKSYQKDMKIVEYEDTLKSFGKNSKEVFKVKKELGEIVYELNKIKEVEDYNKAFKEFKEIYEYIDKEIFFKII
ncbi:MAG TPA: YlbF family regulator [Candidatus Onthovivens sp.]|nr:YlbF family regulator [Candidatus Onthovivens sp.]